MDYTLPRLETSSINSGYSGKRVAIVFFQFKVWKNRKIPNESFCQQNDPKSWGTISNIERKMATKNKAIPFISYGDMRLLIVWW